MLPEPTMKRKGFTLVELLVVIAIIALLLSILMPSLSKARDQARRVVCQSNLKQFGLSYAMYVGQNNGFFEDGVNWTAMSLTMWMDVLRPYYADIDKARCCPATPRPRNLTVTTYGTSKTAWVYNHNNYADYGSYAVNGWLCNPKTWPGGWGDPRNLWRSSEQKGTYNIPILADGLWFHTLPLQTDQPSKFSYQVEDALQCMQRVCSDRHGGKTNVAFMDWTVRSIGLKQLWDLKWHRNYDPSYPDPKWARWPWIMKY
jgi:prepilin-type N-terminal cleavage/methylation domain-containing protein/prepilin-type processing-associated H-X9-DG protein